MPASRSVVVELEEQRCLIEQQDVTIKRQQRRIELQLRLMTEMQAQIDQIQWTLQRAPSRAGALEPAPWNRPRNDSSRAQQRFPAAIDRASRAQGAAAGERQYKGGGVTEVGRSHERSEANATRRT